MCHGPFLRAARVWLLAILSLALPWNGTAKAHELTPTVAEFSVDGNALTLLFRLNAEAFLAGIDMDSVADSNDASEGAVYDDLRFLDPDGLEARFLPFAEAWIKEVEIDIAGPVTLEITGFDAGPLGDPRVARSSQLVVAATVPPLAREMVLTWPAGAGALILRQLGVEEPYTGFIQGGTSTPPIALDGGGEASGWQVFAQYIPVGFEHIVPLGLDHILFVLGLFFLGTAWRTLLWQVSAFTLAHTVTLALGALGWVRVPPSIVEPLIAASIVYVAVENIFLGHLTRWRTLVIFAFGLLHGLGFASVLGEFGLPRGQFFPALIGFNVGVEFGQLAVIAAAFLCVGLWFGQKAWYHARIAVPASAVIAAVGAWWFIERVFL
ncbi:MAG: HupE/UreJ family protein [Pseudomonadota bacterium]